MNPQDDNWAKVVKLFDPDEFNYIRHDRNRKVRVWSDVEGPRHALPYDLASRLTTIDLSGTLPGDTLPDSVSGSIFIAVVDGNWFLVNTEGYEYCRYVARIRIKGDAADNARVQRRLDKLAQQFPLPAKFEVTPCDKGVRILNKNSGKSVEVPERSYKMVREILSALNS